MSEDVTFMRGETFSYLFCFLVLFLHLLSSCLLSTV